MTRFGVDLEKYGVRDMQSRLNTLTMHRESTTKPHRAKKKVDHTPDTKRNEDVRKWQVDLPQALTIATTWYTDNAMPFSSFGARHALQRRSIQLEPGVPHLLCHHIYNTL